MKAHVYPRLKYRVKFGKQTEYYQSLKDAKTILEYEKMHHELVYIERYAMGEWVTYRKATT